MKRNFKYLPLYTLFILFFVQHEVIVAQNFEDKTIDAIIVTPVSLVSFNATKANSNVILTWKTATEINNSHFVIERSTNGVDFSSIAQVAGRGNSNTLNNYSFTDVNTPMVNLYYRLQQVDFNGNSVYSSVVLIRASKGTQPTIAIFPNPIKEFKVNINTSNVAIGKYIVSIKSIEGKNIWYTVENMVDNNQTFVVQLPETTQQGTYILQISNTSGTTQLSQKFVIQ